MEYKAIIKEIIAIIDKINKEEYLKELYRAILLKVWDVIVRGKASIIGFMKKGKFSVGKKVPPRNIMGVIIKFVTKAWSAWDFISIADVSPKLAKIKAFKKTVRKK